VEVDVYRSLGPKRAEPLPGSTSFFQEGLNKWRELNSAEHWLAAASALSPLCQTLPLLVHHREEVLEVLLGGLRMEAVLSLEPLLELTGTLARDLQADFLPALDRVLAALADLVDEGEWSECIDWLASSCSIGWVCLENVVSEAGVQVARQPGGCGLVAAARQRLAAAAASAPAGLEREPEQLQHLFGCLSLICKHLSKLLAAEQELLGMLKASQRLRHHRADHVRALAAEALGFLFRWGIQGLTTLWHHGQAVLCLGICGRNCVLACSVWCACWQQGMPLAAPAGKPPAPPSEWESRQLWPRQ
jgi:hypothetical protein